MSPRRQSSSFTSASDLEREDLAAELRHAVSGEVRFDDGSRALYATDSSNYQQVPIGVVLPKTNEDVLATIDACRRFGAPILSRGAGTSLAGQTCNVAVVIDFSKYMDRILEIDPDCKIARVQPGVVLDDLRNSAEQHHLTFGPDPATHDRCTLGGMIGNNSCGVHSIMAGMTDDNVDELDIVTYDGLRMRVRPTSDAQFDRIIAGGGREGDIYRDVRALRDRYAALIRERYPDIPRRCSGYNLPALLPENGFHVARALVGSEGTCVTVLEATVRLIHSPAARVLVVLGYEDIYTACDHVPGLLQYGPIGLEGFDDSLVGDMRKKGMERSDLALLPKGRGWLLVEFGADEADEARGKAQKFIDDLKGKTGGPDSRLFTEQSEQKKIWEVRESALGATALVPGESETWPGWEDAAVPPAKLGEYLRDFRKLVDEYGYHAALYGHFGQGCTHTRIDFDFVTASGINKFRSFIEHAADLVVRYGGSLSGEHGDGQSRAELLPKMFGPELVQAFDEFKTIWDPQRKMNPGKVVEPYLIDQNLRVGTHYRPPRLKTHFSFSQDGGSFATATLRCVGVGKCRKHEGGTMCPSYMVTREEMDSTRGRARLLFEMLKGNPLELGWRNDSVKEALDLCLACKGCKGECPVQVDMATYKAEFLSHYYPGKLRPVTAYSMGLIYWWARLASHAPDLVNLATQTPLLRDIARRLGGIAPQRRIPAFAPQTFREWFHARGPRTTGGRRVILWPDTFNNHFFPQTAIAAVEVLEDAGYTVTIPERQLCCGRPLYDFGFLGAARRLLRQTIESLHAEIEAGVPVIGLEPSCVSVFRDELVNLFPHDEDAIRLSQQTCLLTDFLHNEGYQPPKLRRKALVHGHCHHKAIMKMTGEQALFQAMDLDLAIPDSGCCGMAGAFGFEKDHYDVSIAVGERVLLPAVRNAPDDALIIAGGFSCREQIMQTTGRHVLHPAQVLQLTLRQKDGEHDIETLSLTPQSAAYPGKKAAMLVTGLGLGTLVWTILRRR